MARPGMAAPVMAWPEDEDAEQASRGQNNTHTPGQTKNDNIENCVSCCAELFCLLRDGQQQQQPTATTMLLLAPRIVVVAVAVVVVVVEFRSSSLRFTSWSTWARTRSCSFVWLTSVMLFVLQCVCVGVCVPITIKR